MRSKKTQLFGGSLLVAVVAIAFRILAWVLFSRTPFFETPVVDAYTFDAWARAIVEGEMFQPGAFFKPPLYPYLLSLLYRIPFMGAVGITVVQMLVGVCSSLLVFVLGRRIFGRGVALTGALITACWPVFPFFETQLLVETWTILLVLFALERLTPCTAGALQKPGLDRLATAGAVLGVAALGRPNLMLLIVAIAGWSAWTSSREGSGRIVKAAVVIVAGLLMILPTTVRNWRAEGSPVLISANLGANLYAGHYDGADGIEAIPIGLRWQELQQRCERAGQGGTVASSRYLSGLAGDWIIEHPGRTLVLLGRKVLVLFSGWEARNNVGASWLANEHGVFILARWWPSTWLVLPFAFVGLFFARRRPGVGLLLLSLGIMAVSVLPFFVNSRFRLLLLPLVALFAAFGVVEMFRRWRDKGLRALMVPVLILVTGFVFVNVDWLDLDDPRRAAEDAYNEGLIVHGKMGAGTSLDPAAAQPLYERAVALNPLFPDGHFGLGLSLLEQAEQEMETVRNDLQAGSVAGLTRIAGKAGDMLTRADAAFARADELVPHSARLYQARGKTSLTMGQLGSYLAAGAYMADDEPAMRGNVGVAAGRYEEAHRRLNEARKLDRNAQRTLELLRILEESERSLQRFIQVEISAPTQGSPEDGPTSR